MATIGFFASTHESVPRAGLSGGGFVRRTLAWCLWMVLTLAVAPFSRAGQPVTVVDVLVVYTPQARVGAGGASSIEAKISLAVAEANSVFQNSKANVRVRLAHVAEIAYAESGSLATDVNRLQLANDGFLDQTHSLRSQYGADLVCLITERGTDYAFYGLQGPSADKAFSVIRRRHLTGQYYFPVVLSFNFGCQLERPYADSVAAFAFSYGHTARAGSEWFSSVEAFDGTRLPYFSNPDIVLGGADEVASFRLGVPEGLPGAANNTKTLNLTTPVVSVFRGKAVQTLPPAVFIVGAAGTSTNPVEVIARANLTLRAVSDDPDGKVARVDFFARNADGDGFRLLGSAGPGPFTLIWSNVPTGDHSVFAYAVDNAGATTHSGEDLVVHSTFVPPPNDNFSNRVALTGTDISITADNEGATIEEGELSWNGASVWYSWTAPADGRVTLAIPETLLRTSFGVFTGEVVSELTHVTNNGHGGGRESSIDFVVDQAATYHISVQGSYGEPSRFTLLLQFYRTPNVQIIRPVGSARFAAGESIDIEAEAFAPSGTALARVEILGDDLLLTARTNAPYTATWQNVSPGFHTITATAYDTAGENRISAPVTIVVTPPNDDFAQRTVVSGRDWLVSGLTQGASLEPGEPEHGGVPVWNSVWWSWTAPASGPARVATASVFFWQALGVYTGTVISNLSLVGSNYATIGFPAVVEFAAVAGVTYHFAVSAVAAGPESGIFTLSLALSAPPDNDAFANAFPLNGSSLTVTSQSAFATKELGEPDHAGNTGGRSVWWRWMTPTSGNAEVSVVAGGFTPLIAVYSGDTLASLIPLAAATNRPVQFRAAAGSEYRIAVDGLFATGGNYTLRLKLDAGPPNDDFTNAIPLTGFSLVVTGSNVAASLEPGEPAHGDLPGGRSVWWSWTAPTDGLLEIDPRNTTLFERMVAVYTGNGLTNLTRVAASSTSFFTLFKLNARAGQVYHIAVAGVDRGSGAASGDIELRLTETPVPPNDDFANRIAVTGTNFVLAFTNVVASREAGEPQHGAEGDHSMWWSWTAPASGRATVWAFSWSVNTLAGVYQGNSLANLVPVGTRAYYWNLLFGGASTAMVSFNAAGGTTYQIAVDSRGTGGGTIGLVLNFSPPQPNDSFAGRRSLVGTNIEFQTSNLGATAEFGEPGHAGTPAARSVWFSWTAPSTGVVKFGVWNSFVPLRWTAYTGNTLTSLAGVASAESSPFLPEAAINSFRVETGRSYQFAIDDIEGSSWPVEGFFTLGLTFSPQPVNDDFEQAYILSGTFVFASGSTIAATRQAGEPQHGSGLSTLWWHWTPPENGTGILDASTSAVPVTLTVYTGSSLTNLTHVAGSGERVLFAAQGGMTYHVAVEQADPGDGGLVSFSLLLSHLRLSSPTNGTVLHQPIDLLLSAESEAADGSFAQIDFVSNGSTVGAATNTPFSIVWSNAPLGTQALTLRATNDVGWVHETLPISVVIRPENDDFGGRIALSAGADVQVYGSAFAATEEPTESPTGLGSVWYSWTAPASGRAQVYVAGSSGPQVRAFRGTALGALVEMAPGPAAEVWFDAEPGQSYELAALAPPNSASQFLLGIRLYPHPTNDNFATRVALMGTNAYANGSILGASHEPSEPLHAGKPGHPSHGSVWWEWIAPRSGQITLFVETSFWSPLLAVYSGNALTNLQPVASAAGTTLTFAARAGDAFLIALDGEGNGNGNFGLWLTSLPGPANDDFRDRGTLNGEAVTVSGSNRDAFGESGEPAHAGRPGGHSVWWAWTAPAAGRAEITVTADGWSSLLAVYIGTVLTNLAPVVAVPGASLSFATTAGTTYLIALDGDSGSAGDFTLSLAFGLPPSNDLFANRAVLAGEAARFIGSTYFAAKEPGEPNHAGQPGGHSVWWEWTAPGSGPVVLNVEGAGAVPALAVYTGNTLSELVETVAAAAPTLTFVAASGTVYQIALDTGVAEFADATLSLLLQVPPANDHFTNRFTLSGLATTANGANVLATQEPDESLPGGASGKTLWWTWSAPTNVLVRLSTAGSLFDGGSVPLAVNPVSAKSVLGLCSRIIFRRRYRKHLPNFRGRAQRRQRLRHVESHGPTYRATCERRFCRAHRCERRHGFRDDIESFCDQRARRAEPCWGRRRSVRVVDLDRSCFWTCATVCLWQLTRAAWRLQGRRGR